MKQDLRAPMGRIAGASLLFCALALAGCAQPAPERASVSAPPPSQVVRHPVANFPISSAVEVPAGASTVYLSGTVPPQRADGSYGNMEEQTTGVLQSISAQLSQLGLGMGDVVRMQAFLVGDRHQGGRLDFDGFMRGYTRFFGTAGQPSLPARSAFQVAALGHPEWLVEIEVTAVRLPASR
ncbi:RidA family protein [Comamonas sp. NLF-1-9]|uniref:RidA family protein n=1 Tax=Comamonas sp. NLF-1-9 TaxID=2853163 RepID=UPI0021053286|nr:RidA family protein [Comamonas sp. NLF-1-9]